MTSAAFFDVDNTLMRGASMFHLAQGLHRRGILTTRDLVSGAWKQLWFRVVGVEDPKHVREVRESALAFIKGQRVDEFTATAQCIFEEAMSERIWPGTKALAQRHVKEGRRVWLVTAAPIEIAQIIADDLGLTGALGTVAENVDGRYTGTLRGEFLHGPAKATAVSELAEREGIDLAASYAYSDSSNDLPMLSLVGYPGVINPDTKLRQHARRNGWPIRDFRTGRRAARTGLTLTGLTGAVAGAIAYRKRKRP